MSECVVDASVLLAILNDEPVPLDVFRILDGAVMSAVNYAEVLAKLAELGPKTFPQTKGLFSLLDRIEPFTPTQAFLSGELRPITRNAGLSLGDRACMALALELNADVYTADRAWTKVAVGLRIHLIR